MIKRVLIIAAAVAGVAGCARPSSRNHPPAAPNHPAPPSCDCDKKMHPPTVSDGTPRWG
jgi:hypothetical protein